MFSILIIVHLRFHVTLDNMTMIKKATNRKYSGDAGKWEPLFIVGGVTYSVENSQIAKIRSAVRPSPAAPWHIPKGLGVLLHRFLLNHVLCCRSHRSW